MGTHMQRNCDSHPSMHAHIRDAAARLRSHCCGSMGDAIDSLGPAASKDCCASAESSTCRSVHTLIKTERSHFAAIKECDIASDSYCGIDLKPKRLFEQHRSVAVRKSAPLSFSCAVDGDCNWYSAGSGFDGNLNRVEKFADEGSEASVVITINEKSQPMVVCCMCGDAGIAELLFLCSRCYRHQHIYCSRSYPKGHEEAYICNWCLHEEDATVLRCSTKASDHGGFTSKTVGGSTSSSSPRLGHGCEGMRMHEEMQQDDGKMTMSPQTSHSKAFEYLLLIAAQSLPQVNRSLSRTGVEIKQENRIRDSINSNRVSLPEMAKSYSPPLANIVNLKPHHAEDKPDPIEINPLNNKSSVINEGSHQNVKIHDHVKISINHKNIDVGRLIEGSIPKRHRCNKGINAPLKCRKKGLHLSPSKPSYRRYKLLADVVC